MLQLLFQVAPDSTSAAHALLHTVLARTYHLPNPRFSRAPGGKPILENSSLHFNLSHSGSFALCGVGDCPLGVDVERIKPRRPGLPRHVLSDEEYAWFLAGGSRWEDFYTLWTLKESLIKYTGQGMDRSMRSIAVPLLSCGKREQLDGLWFRTYGGTGWRAACCAQEPPPALTFQDTIATELC